MLLLIRASAGRYWARLSSDLVIEKELMKTIKSLGMLMIIFFLPSMILMY